MGGTTAGRRHNHVRTQRLLGLRQIVLRQEICVVQPNARRLRYGGAGTVRECLRIDVGRNFARRMTVASHPSPLARREDLHRHRPHPPAEPAKTYCLDSKLSGGGRPRRRPRTAAQNWSTAAPQRNANSRVQKSDRTADVSARALGGTHRGSPGERGKPAQESARSQVGSSSGQTGHKSGSESLRPSSAVRHIADESWGAGQGHDFSDEQSRHFDWRQGDRRVEPSLRYATPRRFPES